MQQGRISTIDALMAIALVIVGGIAGVPGMLAHLHNQTGPRKNNTDQTTHRASPDADNPDRSAWWPQ
jgi:hypothetical protein